MCCPEEIAWRQGFKVRLALDAAMVLGSRPHDRIVRGWVEGGVTGRMLD